MPIYSEGGNEDSRTPPITGGGSLRPVDIAQGSLADVLEYSEAINALARYMKANGYGSVVVTQNGGAAFYTGNFLTEHLDALNAADNREIGKREPTDASKSDWSGAQVSDGEWKGRTT